MQIYAREILGINCELIINTKHDYFLDNNKTGNTRLPVDLYFIY